MNALEFLGRLSRAKENVKIAQREIGVAEQTILERDLERDPEPDPALALARVKLALQRARQATADLQTLVETIESV